MLALSSSSEAGNRLRAKRERRHLSIRDVERFSQRIVEEKKNPAYYVPHNWVSDLENGKSKPRLEKFHSLSLIYKCDINEILALFGLNIGDLDKEQGLIALPYTHLSGRAISRAEPMVPTSLKLQDKVLLEHDPLIRPGAFVQIDPHQNKVTKGIWPSEYDRPVYFVELRDNRYACGWCDYEGSRLLVVPSPKSPVAIRSFRYPQDAEIVGRVTGFAMLIAELRTDTSATPSQGPTTP